MNERFDDMMRKRLQGHKSDVPEGLFDAISQRADVQDAFFDNAIRSKLDTVESPVPAPLFDAVDAGVDMNHLGFDSAVRSKTENAVSPVPAGMWQRIIAEKDHRRRPVAWWWMAATALLLLTGGTFYLLNNKLLNPSSVDASLATATPRPGIFSQNRKGTSANTEDSVSADEPGTAGVSDNVGKGAYPKPDSAANQNSQTVRKLSDNRGFFVIHSNKPEGFVIPLADDIPTSNTDEVQTGSSLPVIQENNVSGYRFTTISLLRQASRFSPGQLFYAKSAIPVIPCPTNEDDRRKNWYVEAYGSAFLLQKQVQDNYMGKNAKAGFDSTLHQQLSFNAGISIVKNLGENFLLKTGLQYNRINESFRLTQVNERRLITTISVRTVIISPGDTVYIRDTSVTEKIGTAQYRTRNTYTQWDVPLIIGYEFGGENLHLNVNAGIIANIRSAYRGEMLADSTRKIFDINHYNGQPVYRKTVGFSLYAGLSIIKPLSGRASLLIEPFTRIGLSNVANSQAWFSQKNSTMGLSIGLRYKLNSSRQRMY